MATFVLVPGALHGGWWFEPLARDLRAHGHRAHALTLSGLGERRRDAAGQVNLDTHIEDVLAVLELHRIEDAVLVGHSYGGMVATGAADRAPARIAGLVYADAFVPRDGESAFDLCNEEWRTRYLEGAAGTGHSLVGLNPALDPRTTPQPIGTLLQRIRLTGAGEAVTNRTYVHAAAFEGSPFLPTYRRLSADPAWTVHALPVGHDLMREAPDDLLRITLAAAPADTLRT
ncbi:alpha/beta fold hydrolase [Kitasatospora sp. NPDC059571]|uniref:alpha/beta fold hydrolase n=1 Tax=Kitasatospora sp. NPDC059571 TaxID=3346871 RepID=UPI0036AC5C76